MIMITMIMMMTNEKLLFSFSFFFFTDLTLLSGMCVQLTHTHTKKSGHVNHRIVRKRQTIVENVVFSGGKKRRKILCCAKKP